MTAKKNIKKLYWSENSRGKDSVFQEQASKQTDKQQ